MTSINGKSLLLLLGALALAGCSSHGMLPEPANQSDVPAPQPEAPPAAEEAGPLILHEPLMAREASSWWSELNEALFVGLHTSVAPGDNEIAGNEYMAASANVEQMPVVVGTEWFLPVIENRPLLKSALRTSFVTYGLRDIPVGDQISRVRLVGGSELGSAPDAAIWIGVSDYGKERMRWFGPYTPDSSEALLVDVSLFGVDTVNASERAYITVLTHGGCNAVALRLHVEIGPQLMFPLLPILPLPDFEWEF